MTSSNGTIVEVTDIYQLRCSDRMNWQVFKLKGVKKRGEDGKASGKVEKQWVGLPSFHGTVSSGVMWILKDMSKSSKKDKVTLNEFLEEMNKVSNKVIRSIRKKENAGEL